ncbi:MAG TPA: cation:proton antiporter, partial [Usitatibacter sp.]|nr:cation:proton antiporter [Usitatibacter sp.]
MIDGVLLMPLLLAMVIAVLGFIAERIALPSPPIMVLGGSALAFLPGLPQVHHTPEIVLLVFLPPLLYSAGVGMSWRGFRSNKRPIGLLAVGCVLLTATAVAAVAHYSLDMEWAPAFVLGAIVSAPDAVPVLALLRNAQLPRRIITILEGESLVNDATALVLLAFALNAVATGSFSLAGAAMKFVAICTGEVAYGASLGWLMLRLRRSASIPRSEVLLALATPYLAFWPPHAIGGSGVIACVAVGLYVSWNGRHFISPETRLQGYFIWDLVVWTTESM